MRLKHYPVNAQLCEVLGVDANNVTALALHARVGYLPTITITQILKGDALPKLQTFFLQPLRDADTTSQVPGALNLDRAVAEAHQRLRAALEDDVREHLREMRFDYFLGLMRSKMRLMDRAEV